MKRPVVLLIFNRPKTTKRVFEAIREYQPKQLFVVADGPRIDKLGEEEKCIETRSLIDSVDWKCEVVTNFSDVNLGCGLRVSSGLDWVFELVKEAIIVEDDCLPHPSFFYFCEELLEKYRHDERIMHIAGTNVLGKWQSQQNYSYHFSYTGGIWGWATWKRAWKHYDFKMSLWSDLEARNRLRDVAGNQFFSQTEKTFEAVYRGEIDTWDLQWIFSRTIQSGLSIIPAVNLISNIGFGEDATHTTSDVEASDLAAMNVFELAFPLNHNSIVAPNRDFDLAYFNQTAKKKVISRLIHKLKTNLVCNFN